MKRRWFWLFNLFHPFLHRPFAVSLALSIAPRECSKIAHATGFRQWLMTNFFLSAESIRRLGGQTYGKPKIRCEVQLLRAEIFSAVQEHCPPENHSPITIRHLLPFRLAERLGFKLPKFYSVHMSNCKITTGRRESNIIFMETIPR